VDKAVFTAKFDVTSPQMNPYLKLLQQVAA
jgi:hypothetical protein